MIDYRNKSPQQLAKDIQSSAAGRGVDCVYDAVSESSIKDAIAYGLQPRGGSVTHVLPYSSSGPMDSPKNVKFTQTLVGAAHAGKEDFAAKWYKELGTWLESGTFRPQSVTIVTGGLRGVEEGLRRLEEGAVSSEKLVYLIADTPGL